MPSIILGGCATVTYPPGATVSAIEAQEIRNFEFRNALYSSNPYFYKSPSVPSEITQTLRSHWKQKKTAGYVVFYLKVQDQWAIFEGLPLAVFRARDLPEACRKANASGFPTGVDRFFAVLRKSGGRWRVMESGPCIGVPATSEAKRLQKLGVPPTLAEDHFFMRTALQNSIPSPR